MVKHEGNGKYRYNPEKLDAPQTCLQCGKLTRNAEIWNLSGIVIPLCNQTCYDKYWAEISKLCNS